MRAFLLVLLVAGCGTPTYTWVREGATAEDSDRDYVACTKPHTTSSYIFGAFGAIGALASTTRDESIRDCMQLKGYKKSVDENRTTASSIEPKTAGATTSDDAKRLERLKELRDRGLISEAEFQSKRKEILDGI